MAMYEALIFQSNIMSSRVINNLVLMYICAASRWQSNYRQRGGARSC